MCLMEIDRKTQQMLYCPHKHIYFLLLFAYGITKSLFLFVGIDRTSNYFVIPSATMYIFYNVLHTMLPNIVFNKK